MSSRPRSVDPRQRIGERSAEQGGALTDRAVRDDLARLARFGPDATPNQPWLDVAEQPAPGTPPQGWLRLYAKTDGKLYTKNDAGTESQVPGDFLLLAGGIVTGNLTVDADLIIASGGTQTLRLYDSGVIEFAAGSPNIRTVVGNPEGVVSAVPGSEALSTDGNVYRKGSGAGNTGWVAT